jgi:hypothetical protein
VIAAGRAPTRTQIAVALCPAGTTESTLARRRNRTWSRAGQVGLDRTAPCRPESSGERESAWTRHLA